MSKNLSAARLASNRANAANSTGPRTEAGKARTAENARTHGLTAKHAVVGDDEREEWAALEREYAASIAPEGPVETTLFEELLTAAWNLRRVRKMEAELNATALDSLSAALDDELQKRLERVGRHHTRIERTFHRSLKELKALQTERAHRLTLPNIGSLPELTEIASTIEISKQTQAFARAHSNNLLEWVEDRRNTTLREFTEAEKSRKRETA